MDPPVSVILPTRNRPRLLAVALQCYREQTYHGRELIVVDDSDTPIDPEPVQRVGGKVLHVEPGTPIGAKTNAGIVCAQGSLVQRIDDDDWYAPEFLQHMVDSYQRQRSAEVCRPLVVGISRQLFFHVKSWQLRRSPWRFLSGNTFVFSRADWEDLSYRPLNMAEDWWLLKDLHALDGLALQVPGELHMIQVRHGNHAWNNIKGEGIAQWMQGWPLHEEPPEAVLPNWALDVYRTIRDGDQSG